MREAIETIIRSLVDNADAVDIRELERNGSHLIEVRVAPEDVGKVIGKQGRTIRSLRSLTRAVGSKYNKRYMLEIVE